MIFKAEHVYKVGALGAVVNADHNGRSGFGTPRPCRCKHEHDVQLMVPSTMIVQYENAAIILEVDNGPSLVHRSTSSTNANKVQRGRSVQLARSYDTHPKHSPSSTSLR